MIVFTTKIRRSKKEFKATLNIRASSAVNVLNHELNKEKERNLYVDVHPD